jgi:hypothetical protein
LATCLCHHPRAVVFIGSEYQVSGRYYIFFTRQSRSGTPNLITRRLVENTHIKRKVDAASRAEPDNATCGTLPNI